MPGIGTNRRAIGCTAAAALALAAVMGTAHAQPVDLPIPPATTDQYPAGVKVVKSASRSVYTNQRGLTLYGLDMRTVMRAGPDPAVYCKNECAALWEPLLPPAGTKANLVLPRGFGSPPPAAGQQVPAAQPQGPGPGPDGMYAAQRAPDWTVINGAAGPQWVYKGWHLVFVRKGDKPGSTAFEGTEGLTWNTLKFKPPVPKIVAPQSVVPLFDRTGYVLADKQGRVLFTGSCRKTCGEWQPLAAAAAGRGVGEWTVSRSGDSPQWLYRGKPVFVSLAADPLTVPASGKALQP